MRKTLALLALTIGIGCSFSTPDLAGKACSPSGECPEGLVCSANECVRSGSGDAGSAGSADSAVADQDASPWDMDSDGVDDSVDNCPGVRNSAQEDEDLDGLGDPCDNCPGIGNADQLDVGETNVGAEADGVGDICDPRPNAGGDTIVAFDGFNGTELGAGWTRADMSGIWSVSGGALHQSNATNTSVLYYDGGALARVTIELGTVIDEISPEPGGPRSVAAIVRYSPAPGSGFLCSLGYDAGEMGPTTYLSVVRLTDALDRIDVIANEQLMTGRNYFFKATDDTSNFSLTCTWASLSNIETIEASVEAGLSRLVGLRTESVAATFKYVTIYGVE